MPDGGAEPTTPVTDLPPVPAGPATARVEWPQDRGTASAELDDQPSGCRAVPGDAGTTLVVELGDPDVAGTARTADRLRLEVGPLARPDGAEPDSGYLATVQRLELVISGGDPPAGSEAIGTIASVDADLTHLRLPLADGSVAITCEP
ncbi:hypothetical protein PO878_01490 [Iamia majanohamensis]|uniref:Uncharacterized protein n=1 Tax=Iamia majanohamensis TaxID=467976 RepID=A0AAF0BW36_9ACTN|nr:hypothetical protein [Iamia majanohamensis]WCO67390.1 hypothetical protein PO878_01490 [Iamia majanohamensis]